MNINKKAKVFLKKEIFDYQYISIRGNTKRDIGYSNDLLDYKDRFVFLQENNFNYDNLYFFRNIKKTYPLPKGNGILYKQKGGEVSKDDFNHELIFAIETTNGIHIFCGCAHNGIINIVYTVQQILIRPIKTIIGGFHLIDNNEFVNVETDQEITAIAKELKRLTNGANYYTGHCTGNNAYKTLSPILGTSFQKLTLGNSISI